MSKLLYIFERDMPTVSITRDIMTHLEMYPQIKCRFVYLCDVTPKDVEESDIVVFIRPDNMYSSRVAEISRKSGRLVITFCDDDLLNLPNTLPSMPWRVRGLKKTLAYSDVIWSSSKYLANK